MSKCKNVIDYIQVLSDMEKCAGDTDCIHACSDSIIESGDSWANMKAIDMCTGRYIATHFDIAIKSKDLSVMLGLAKQKGRLGELRFRKVLAKSMEISNVNKNDDIDHVPLAKIGCIAAKYDSRFSGSVYNISDIILKRGGAYDNTLLMFELSDERSEAHFNRYLEIEDEDDY